MNIKHILLVVAMKEEADYIKQKIPFVAVIHPKIEAVAALEYQFHRGDTLITMVVSGNDAEFQTTRLGAAVGLLASHAYAQYHPDVVLNPGCAGGISAQEVGIGDICIGTQTLFHDHFMGGDTHNTLYAQNKRECVDVNNLIANSGLSKRCKVGVISTGSSMENMPAQMEQIKQTCAIAKDMEAAFIHDAIKANTKKPGQLIPIKVIVDLADTQQCTQKSFTENFPQNLESLAGFMQLFCENIFKHGIDSIEEMVEHNRKAFSMFA